MGEEIVVTAFISVMLAFLAKRIRIYRRVCSLERALRFRISVKMRMNVIEYSDERGVILVGYSEPPLFSRFSYQMHYPKMLNWENSEKEMSKEDCAEIMRRILMWSEARQEKIYFYPE